jgi:cell wall-associated NlpC family hydrolase
VAERQAALARTSAVDFAAAVAAAGGTVDGGMTPPNDTAAAAIAAARSRLGDPYVWGATGPDTFDCSGLTQWAYAHAGVTLPRVAADQFRVGARVSLGDLEPGDLLFWAIDVNDPATIHHVAMYIGNGLMIAAPHTGDVVKVQPVYLSEFIGATRPYAS